MIEITSNNECGIMIDLSAALDTVNHAYLLEDLKQICYMNHAQTVPMEKELLTTVRRDYSINCQWK